MLAAGPILRDVSPGNSAEKLAQGEFLRQKNAKFAGSTMALGYFHAFRILRQKYFLVTKCNPLTFYYGGRNIFTTHVVKEHLSSMTHGGRQVQIDRRW
jgi:hypothetical protein